MRTFLLVLLAAPLSARHIVEGPIGEIVEATKAVAQLDGELRSPGISSERREQVQEERAGRVEQIAGVAAANPDDASVNLAAANGLVGVREPVRAEQAADRAVRAVPSNPDAYLVRGRARMEQGRYEDAVKDFQETLRLRPGDKAALASLKLSEGRTRQTGSVSPAVPAAANPSVPSTDSVQKPSVPDAAATVALSDFDRRNAEKNRVNQLTMEHYNAALAAQAAKDWKKARSEIEKALALQPDAPILREYQASLTAARDAALNDQKVSPSPKQEGRSEPKSLGTSNFIGGLFHYIGKELEAASR